MIFCHKYKYWGDVMTSINDVKLLSFPVHGDARGNLVVIEGGKDKILPFEIKRVFYIYGTSSDDVRGKHANKHSALCLVNVCGQSTVRVVDYTGVEKVYTLNEPHTGLYIPEMIWKDMYNFSTDSVLLVFSNEYYDKSEYISDFDDFLSLARRG